MKNLHHITHSIFCLAASAALAAHPGALLDTSWKFMKGDAPGGEKTLFDDSTWEVVTIPHTWNMDILEKGPETYLGVSWYRTLLEIEEGQQEGTRRFLRFEGALTVADVYLNGTHLGQHRGGYSAFCFEITSLLHSGKNLLAVRVDNAYNPDIAPADANLFTRWGGLYRPVTLIEKAPVCITPLDFAGPGSYALQESVSAEQASLRFTAKVSNGEATAVERTLVFTVEDADDNRLAEVSTTVTIPAGETVAVSAPCTISKPHLWNGRKDPYLHTFTTRVSDGKRDSDVVVQPLGLRYFKVDQEGGLFLNGAHLPLYGVCRHQEWEQYGSALSDAQHDSDVDTIYEMGANGLRLAHYQQADRMYERCDGNGIVVWAEIPCAGSKIGWKTGAYHDNCRQQLTELIRQNFNHPSILFWGLYNESPINEWGVRDLHELAKQEDPSRLTTGGSNRHLQKKHEITDLVCWNTYPYWYGGGRNLTQWRKSLLRRNPKLCVGISEYGAGGCYNQHSLSKTGPNPIDGKFYPEEYQAYAHEQVWRDIKDSKALWCSFIWNAFDFSWPTVNRGYRPYVNNKGLSTFDRKTRKDAFYFYKANWSEEPVLYLTSRRFVLRHESIQPVRVYANTSEVELFVNGKSHGTRKPDDIHIAQWDHIELKPGENHISVRAVHGGKSLSDQCRWTYEEPPVSASNVEKPNVPSNVLDGDQDTFWCGKGMGIYLQYDLSTLQTVSGIELAWYKGDARHYRFKVLLSNDANQWSEVYAGQSDGKSSQLVPITFAAQPAKYIRIVCNGNDVTEEWAAITEMRVLAVDD